MNIPITRTRTHTLAVRAVLTPHNKNKGCFKISKRKRDEKKKTALVGGPLPVGVSQRDLLLKLSPHLVVRQGFLPQVEKLVKVKLAVSVFIPPLERILGEKHPTPEPPSVCRLRHARAQFG